MDWHIYRRGEQTGPIKDVDFLRMISEKLVDREDLVWNQNMKDWIPAGEVPGLFERDNQTDDQVHNDNKSEKEKLVNLLLNYSEAGPFQIIRGEDTDLVVSNEVVSSQWFSGKKKVTYAARILLDEKEKTAYFWEMLKESSSGLSFKIGSEKKKIKGIELFQQNREKGYSPAGELVYDYQFDYGSLREAFKSIIEEHGWKLKTVIIKGKTTYK